MSTLLPAIDAIVHQVILEAHARKVNSNNAFKAIRYLVYNRINLIIKQEKKNVLIDNETNQHLLLRY